MTRYTAEVTRDGKFWLIEVPELGAHTQARNVGEIEVMVRDLIALRTDTAEDSFDVDVRIEMPASVRAHLDAAAAERDAAAAANHAASVEMRDAVRELRAAGLSVRDIGAVLGLSHQRAHQLTAS